MQAGRQRIAGRADFFLGTINFSHCIVVLQDEEKVGCIALHVLKNYFMVATYMWMLCEGMCTTYLRQYVTSYIVNLFPIIVCISDRMILQGIGITLWLSIILAYQADQMVLTYIRCFKKFTRVFGLTMSDGQNFYPSLDKKK